MATVMSLAGHVSPDTPEYKAVLSLTIELLALIYPFVYFGILLFAERVIADRWYVIAALLAMLPTVFSIFVISGLVA
jgi:hypothetical protein